MIRKSTSAESARRFLDSYNRRKPKPETTVTVGRGRLLPAPDEWKHYERLFPGMWGDWIMFVNEPITDFTFRLEGTPYVLVATHKNFTKCYVYRRSQWERIHKL